MHACAKLELEQQAEVTMKKILLLVFFVIFLGGCVTSKETIKQNVHEKFVGTPVKDFFLKHGAPHFVFDVDEKTKMYKWSAGGTRMPAIRCDADITAINGQIVQIKLMDSIGRWRLSRCDEVFNP